jgi:hypothetical protein
MIGEPVSTTVYDRASRTPSERSIVVPPRGTGDHFQVVAALAGLPLWRPWCLCGWDDGITLVLADLAT